MANPHRASRARAPLQELTFLQTFVKSKHLSETEAMNILQNHGIVSDNAVHLSEVTDTDEQGAAMTFLLNYTR